MRKRRPTELEPVHWVPVTCCTCSPQLGLQPVGRAQHVRVEPVRPALEPASSAGCCCKTEAQVKVNGCRAQPARVAGLGRAAMLLIGAVAVLSLASCVEPAGASPVPNETTTGGAVDSLVNLLEEAENNLAEVHNLLANRTFQQPIESFIGSRSTSGPHVAPAGARSTEAPASSAPATTATQAAAATTTAIQAETETESQSQTEAQTATSTLNTESADQEGQDERASAERDADDAQDCKGISAHESAAGEKYTDNERLVNLQTCIQARIKSRILSATRTGMEMFDKLSMSGGCTASFFNLMSSLAAIKSFAFKCK